MTRLSLASIMDDNAIIDGLIDDGALSYLPSNIQMIVKSKLLRMANHGHALHNLEQELENLRKEKDDE